MGCLHSKEDVLDSTLHNVESRTKNPNGDIIEATMKKPDIRKFLSNPLTRYHISPKVLGAGGFGKIFLGWAVDEPELKFAIKAINKRAKGVTLSEVQTEVDILK